MKRWRFFSIFFLFIAGVCATALVLILTSDGGDMSEYQIEQPKQEKTVKEKTVKNPIDWEKLRKTNPDAYAWVNVPGTTINYPVLQAGEDKEEDYYLHHALNGSYSFAGSIYTRKKNKKDFSDRITVLYGHNMINGSMFADIRKFADTDFFKNHKKFYIYMPEKVLEYKIVAYHLSDDKEIMEAFGTNSEDGFLQYIDFIKKKGSIRESIEADDSIVTLSTCDSVAGKRRLLQGVLTETHITK